MDPRDIRYLSFEGGGGKGGAYLGALAALAEPEIDLLTPIMTADRGQQYALNKERVYGVAGSSAGAITAVLLASGCDLHDLYSLMTDTATLDSFYDPPYGRTPNSRYIPVFGSKEGCVSEPFPTEDNDWLLEAGCAPEHRWGRIAYLATRGGNPVEVRLAMLLGAQALRYMWCGTLPTALAKITRLDRCVAYLQNLRYDFGFFSGCAAWRTFDAMITRRTVEAAGAGGDDAAAERFERTGVTFLEHYRVHRMPLILTGTNIETGESRFFSVEHTPHVRVVDALRISISLPFVFKPIVIEEGDYKGTWIDGGVLNNNPIHAFDGPHMETRSGRPATLNPAILGLRLDVDTIENPLRIGSLGEFTRAFSLAKQNMAELGQFRTREEREQTIALAVDPLSTFEFVAPAEDLLAVCCAASRQVLAYFRIDELYAGDVLASLFNRRCPPVKRPR